MMVVPLLDCSMMRSVVQSRSKANFRIYRLCVHCYGSRHRGWRSSGQQGGSPFRPRDPSYQGSEFVRCRKFVVVDVGGSAMSDSNISVRDETHKNGKK